MKPLKIAYIIAIVSRIFYSSTALSEDIHPISGYMPSKWSSNIIPVCWENPSDANQEGREWTKEAIKDSWQRYSSLQFIGWSKCHNRSRGIRILIDDYFPHTKGLGNQLDGRKNGMVLNFKFNSWNSSCRKELYFCIKVMAIHEFGHALGFAHEQNRADAPLECQKERQGGDGDTYLTDYDLDSVMNYCNPKWSGNGQLSTKDIEGLQKWYGQPSTSKLQTVSKPDWCVSARLNKAEGIICNHPSLWELDKRNHEMLVTTLLLNLTPEIQAIIRSMSTVDCANVVRLKNKESNRYVLSTGTLVNHNEGGLLQNPNIVGVGEADANYYGQADWCLIHKYEDIYQFQNKQTNHYLFSTGDKHSGTDGDEGGWLKSPMIVGTDANYYKRAMWEVIKNGETYMLKNIETNRYLFSTGEKHSGTDGDEGGWLNSPQLVGADANYYNRALWYIVRLK